MSIYKITQYTIYCDVCSDMGEVMNQSDPVSTGKIWNKADAIKEWRSMGWKISNDLIKCPLHYNKTSEDKDD